jgi:hypothetical protein
MDEQVDKETGEIKSKPKGKGSFWISRQAIEVLLNNKATAMQIAAYLVMAKHTEASGKLATSGIKAIHKATGVSHTIGERAMLALMDMRHENKNNSKLREKADKLIYKPEEWFKLTGDVIPPAPFERAEVRYVLNDFKAKPEDRVWFSNELITGVGKFTQPLKRLKMCGDVAARLLLISYRENNLEQYGGISTLAFCEVYEMKRHPEVKGFDLWHGTHLHGSTFDTAALPALGIKAYPKDKEEAVNPFWDALRSLDSAGFIYQMVTVMDRKQGDAEAQVIYELDTKSKHGYKPIGEEGLAGITAKIAATLGNPVADKTGRFYDKYAAIVPAGIKPHIVGIYRLRFRVSNTKNHGVSSAWTRIQQGQREANEQLNELKNRLQQDV